MKECLQCKKEYEAKRETSKFCSAKCRVKYNRQNPKQRVSKFQMQTLYNSVLAAVEKINSGNWLPPPTTAVLEKDEPLSFEKLKQEAQAVSNYQYHQSKIAKLLFPDDKTEYMYVVNADETLSDKEREKLLMSLKF